MKIENKVLIILSLVLLGGLFGIWYLFLGGYISIFNKKACEEVITPAVNPNTGECKEFPTPCDVPKGWKIVKSCKKELISTKVFGKEDQNALKLENEKIKVLIFKNGNIILQDKHSGKILSSKANTQFFILQVEYNGKNILLTKNDAEDIKIKNLGSTVLITFENLKNLGINLISNISIDNDLVQFGVKIENNNPSIIIKKLYYPILPLNSDLGKGDEYLLAPQAQRYALYKNPETFINKLGPFRSPGSLPMQFVAYYNKNQSIGIYTATYDSEGWIKDLIIKFDNSSLYFLWIHYFPEDHEKEKILPYNVVLTTFEGDWYDAADIYKKWAYKQPWAAETLKERIEEGKVPKWIVNNSLWMAVEADYVKTSNGYERTTERNGSFAFFEDNFWKFIDPWLKFLPTPPVILYRMASKYWNAPSIDYAPSFPNDEVYKNTLIPAKKKGIRAFTFIHDYRLALTFKHVDKQFNKIEEVKNNASPYFVINEKGKPVIEYIPWFGGYAVRLCKHTPYAQNLKLSVGQHYAEIGFSMVQMDQSGGVFEPLCYSKNHGHPPGGGKWYTEDFRKILKKLKEIGRKYEPDFAVSEEGPNELFIQDLDTYMARDYVISWNKNIEIVPAFKYVYNKYINGYTAWACWDGVVVGRTEEEKKEQYNVCIVHLARSLLAGHIAGIIPIPFEVPFITSNGKKYLYYLDFNFKDKDEAPVFKILLQHSILTSDPRSQKFLLFGEMIRPPRLEVDKFELVATSEHGKVSKELPKILHNAFVSDDGEKAVFLVNVVNQSVPAKLYLSDLKDSTTSCTLKVYTFDEGQKKYKVKIIPYKSILNIKLMPYEVRYYVIDCLNT